MFVPSTYTFSRLSSQQSRPTQMQTRSSFPVLSSSELLAMRLLCNLLNFRRTDNCTLVLEDCLPSDTPFGLGGVTEEISLLTPTRLVQISAKKPRHRAASTSASILHCHFQAPNIATTTTTTTSLSSNQNDPLWCSIHPPLHSPITSTNHNQPQQCPAPTSS